jgi:hypothetical protein
VERGRERKEEGKETERAIVRMHCKKALCLSYLQVAKDIAVSLETHLNMANSKKRESFVRGQMQIVSGKFE